MKQTQQIIKGDRPESAGRITGHVFCDKVNEISNNRIVEKLFIA